MDEWEGVCGFYSAAIIAFLFIFVSMLERFSPAGKASVGVEL